MGVGSINTIHDCCEAVAKKTDETLFPTWLVKGLTGLTTENEVALDSLLGCLMDRVDLSKNPRDAREEKPLTDSRNKR